MAKTTAQNWMKNFAKSVGTLTLESVTADLENTMDFFSSNADFVKDSVRELKSPTGFIKTKLAGANVDYVKTAKTLAKNTMDDLRSGNFYNLDRINRVEEDDDDFGFLDDFEDSFDDEFDIDADTVNVENNINVTKVEIGQDSPMVQSTIQNTEAIITSSAKANELNIKLTEANMRQRIDLAKNTSAGLSIVNENLGLLVHFNNNMMSKFIESSLKYYESSINLLGEAVTELKKSNTISAAMAEESASSADMVFNAKGVLDLKAYTNLIRKQTIAEIDGSAFGQIKEFLSDESSIQAIIASPLKSIGEAFAKTMLPGIMRESMQRFDKTLGEFFPALLNKITGLRTSDSPWIRAFGNIFGVSPRSKSSIDMGAYRKEQVPFDGYTKKAITDVIPTYLRKILSALTGGPELGFDYEKGVFNDAYKLRNSFDEEKRKKELYGYSDAMSYMTDAGRKLRDSKGQRIENLDKRIEDFILAVYKHDKVISPYKKSGTTHIDDFTSQIGETLDEQRALNAIFRSMPRNVMMSLFGNAKFRSNREVREFMEKVELNPSAYNAQYMYDESNTDGRKLTDETAKTYRNKGLTDKFGNSTLDYVADIRNILLQGVKVYIAGKVGGGKEIQYRHLTNDITSATSLSSYIRSEFTKNQKTQQPTLSDDKKVEMIQDGHIMLDGSSEEELAKRLRSQMLKPIEVDDKSGFLSRLTGGKVKSLKEFINKAFEAPAKLVSGIFNRLDKGMFNLIFGGEDEENGNSFLTKMIDTVKDKFSQFGGWMKDKILDPIHDKLFGKEGIFSKFKDSETYQRLQKDKQRAKKYLFGTVGADNKRHGGLFSGVANELKQMGNETKYFFTGKKNPEDKTRDPKSVFAHVSNTMKSWKETMKMHLGLDKGEKDKTKSDKPKKPWMDRVIDSLSDGFGTFGEALFGPKYYKGKDGKEYVNSAYTSAADLNAKIKERMPKAMATGVIGGGAGLLLGGKLGYLGSLLLPGGPIGGAIMGSTLGFLGQSERFQNFVFGEKDDETHERIGGLISAGTQKFFKDNKVPIIGGATIGIGKSLLTSAGILPSFLGPGGPITGALMGIGFSLLKNSDSFRKLMFGELSEDDDKYHGGMFSKIKNAVEDEKTRKKFKMAGLGAGMGFLASSALGSFGVLGNALAIGGPIGGAIAGAGLGIAAASDKWKKMVFGEFDEKEGRMVGGMMGQFKNWAKTNVFAPMKVKVENFGLDLANWFTLSIGNPISTALKPFTEAVGRLTDSITDKIKKIFGLDEGLLGKLVKKVAWPIVKYTTLATIKAHTTPLKLGWFGIKTAGRMVGAGISGLVGGAMKRDARRQYKQTNKNNRKMMFRAIRRAMPFSYGAHDEEGNRIGFGSRFKEVWNRAAFYGMHNKYINPSVDDMSDDSAETYNPVTDYRRFRERQKQLKRERRTNNDYFRARKSLLKIMKAANKDNNYKDDPDALYNKANSGLFAALNLNKQQFKEKFGDIDFTDKKNREKILSMVAGMSRKEKKQAKERAKAEEEFRGTGEGRLLTEAENLAENSEKNLQTGVDIKTETEKTNNILLDILNGVNVLTGAPPVDSSRYGVKPVGTSSSSPSSSIRSTINLSGANRASLSGLGVGVSLLDSNNDGDHTNDVNDALDVVEHGIEASGKHDTENSYESLVAWDNRQRAEEAANERHSRISGLLTGLQSTLAGLGGLAADQTGGLGSILTGGLGNLLNLFGGMFGNNQLGTSFMQFGSRIIGGIKNAGGKFVNKFNGTAMSKKLFGAKGLTLGSGLLAAGGLAVIAQAPGALTKMYENVTDPAITKEVNKVWADNNKSIRDKLLSEYSMYYPDNNLFTVLVKGTAYTAGAIADGFIGLKNAIFGEPEDTTPETPEEKKTREQEEYFNTTGYQPSKHGMPEAFDNYVIIDPTDKKRHGTIDWEQLYKDAADGILTGVTPEMVNEYRYGLNGRGNMAQKVFSVDRTVTADIITDKNIARKQRKILIDTYNNCAVYLKVSSTLTPYLYKKNEDYKNRGWYFKWFGSKSDWDTYREGLTDGEKFFIPDDELALEFSGLMSPDNPDSMVISDATPYMMGSPVITDMTLSPSTVKIMSSDYANDINPLDQNTLPDEFKGVVVKDSVSDDVVTAREEKLNQKNKNRKPKSLDAKPTTDIRLDPLLSDYDPNNTPFNDATNAFNLNNSSFLGPSINPSSFNSEYVEGLRKELQSFRKYQETTGGGKGGSVNGFPYFSQNDPSWGGLSYKQSNGTNDGTMAEKGCGPTAMAMVASGMGGSITPVDMANFARKGGYSDDTGTNWNFVDSAASNLGLGVSKQMNPSQSFIDSQLSAGNPVMLSGSSGGGFGPYTPEGHYVVAVGKDRNGNVLVNDPRGKEYSGAYNINELTNETSMAWGFNKGGGFGALSKVKNKVKQFNRKRIVRGGMGGSAQNARDSIIALMKRLEGKLTYSQSNRYHISDALTKGKGSGDCSSTVQFVYRSVLNMDIGSNSRIQASNTKGKTCDSTPGCPNEKNLLPGDLLFFKGKNVQTIGHVEMYIGNGLVMGHGGPGMGPTTKNLTDYCATKTRMGAPYVKAVRFIDPSSAYTVGSLPDGVSTSISSTVSDRFVDGLKNLTFGSGLRGSLYKFLNPANTSSSSTGVSMDSSLNGVSFDSGDATLNAVIDKVYSMTTGNEGNPTSVNPRDSNGKFSVGVLQWNGGRAQKMLQSLAQNASPQNGAIFTKYASRTNGSLTSYEKAELERALKNEGSKAKSTQEKIAKNDIYNSYLKTPWSLYKEGKIGNPASLVQIADIANTAPAYLNKWVKAYANKNLSRKPDLANPTNDLYNTTQSIIYDMHRFGSKSPVFKQDRAMKNYQSLKSWVPKSSTYRQSSYNDSSVGAITGGRGGYVSKGMNYSPASPTNTGTNMRRIRLGGKGQTVDETAKILKEAIDVLKSISENTATTSSGIKDLNNKKIEIDLTGTSLENKSVKASGRMVPSSGQSSSSSSNYNLAKSISQGRNN